MTEPFLFAGVSVLPGTRHRVNVPLPDLNNGAPMSMPVVVYHGVEDGPVVWISAVIHGDEINGVDIIRGLLPHLSPAQMRGTLLVVPSVDVYGLIQGSRYLPDGRDLNRSFPGSKSGSLASRVAHRFKVAVVERCDAGIDLHTAAVGRVNYPQVRGELADETFAALAAAFAARVTMNARTIEGSLRKLARSRGIPYVLYEGGAANRFEPDATAIGVDGCRRVLRHLGLVDDAPDAAHEPILVNKGTWLRAPASGVIDFSTSLGAEVTKGQVVATITDTFGDNPTKVKSSTSGIVVGMATNPLVHGGEAMVHIGKF